MRIIGVVRGIWLKPIVPAGMPMIIYGYHPMDVEGASVEPVMPFLIATNVL